MKNLLTTLNLFLILMLVHFFRPNTGKCQDNNVFTKNNTVKKPKGFRALKNKNGIIMRLSRETFPLKVYSNHFLYSSSEEINKIVGRALEIWNGASGAIGLNMLFDRVKSPADADFIIDWSGTYRDRPLNRSELGVAILTNGTAPYIIGIIMKLPSASNRTTAETTETLLQEMGHILGLNHSTAPKGNDIMYLKAHKHGKTPHDLSEVKLSERDYLMMQWLYNQMNYATIKCL